jgi:hypothetical protein
LKVGWPSCLFVADGFFSIMLFSSCFSKIVIIQELFFQLIVEKKRQSVFFEAYFSGENEQKNELMKTPMDKAIINKNKTKACWT